MLEGPEPTLRLHDLFRDFLQDRLRREMPDELPELHRRAAAGEPDLVRRIGYRIRAGDWTEAEIELAEAGGRIITTVGAAPVLRLLDQFPPPLHARSGRLAHIRCLCAWARWDWPNMREAAERARRAYASAGDTLGAWRAGLYEAISYGSFGFTDEARRRVDEPPPEPLGIDDRAFLAMTRTYQTFDEGRLDVLGQRYREVIDALESSTNIPLWYHCVPRSMQCGMPGMDGPLARFATGALRVLPDMPTPLRALALALRGWEELSAGKVAVAAASVELADSDARWLGPPPNVRVFVYALLPILHALYGRAAEARSALDELMKTFDDPDVGYRPGSFVHVYYSLHRVRIADMLGDVESARALFAQVPDDPRPLNETMRRVLASHRAATIARLAAHDGRAEEAIAAYAEALADADALSVYGQATEVRLRLALVLLGLGRVADAAAAIEEVLAATRSRGSARRRRSHGRRDALARPGRRRLARAAACHGDRHAARLGGIASGDGDGSATTARSRKQRRERCCTARRRSGRAQPARARGAAPHRRRRQQQADRPGVRSQPAHRQAPRREHSRQAGAAVPRPGRRLVPAARGPGRRVSVRPGRGSATDVR